MGKISIPRLYILKKMTAVLCATAAGFFIAFSAYPGTLDPPEIQTTVDKEKANIGDRIKLSLTAQDSKGYEILYPDAPEKLGDFRLLSSGEERSKWPAGKKRGVVYTLSVYSTGTHVIPPIDIMYRKPGEKWQKTASAQVPIEVESLLTGDDEDIKGIKGLITTGSGMVWLIFALVVLILSAVLLVRYYRRGSADGDEDDADRQRTAHEIAYEELKNLRAKDLPGKNMIKEYYTDLSWILRRYIENRFRLNAPEMTTEEFMERSSRYSELDPSQKDILSKFMVQSDMVKFAKHVPKPLDIVDGFKTVEKFIDATKVSEEVEDQI